VNTAAEVEPPPMSMQTLPRSISSSSSAASAETKGAATTPSNCRWARSTQAPRVWNTALGDRDDQQLDAQGAAEHGARVAHPALPVHRPGDRQDVDGATSRQLDLGQRILDRAHQVVVGDRAGARWSTAALHAGRR
jgi:hypothetical protein